MSLVRRLALLSPLLQCESRTGERGNSSPVRRTDSARACLWRCLLFSARFSSFLLTNQATSSSSTSTQQRRPQTLMMRQPEREREHTMLRRPTGSVYVKCFSPSASRLASLLAPCLSLHCLGRCSVSRQRCLVKEWRPCLSAGSHGGLCCRLASPAAIVGRPLARRHSLQSLAPPQQRAAPDAHTNRPAQLAGALIYYWRPHANESLWLAVPRAHCIAHCLVHWLAHCIVQRILQQSAVQLRAPSLARTHKGAARP